MYLLPFNITKYHCLYHCLDTIVSYIPIISTWWFQTLWKYENQFRWWNSQYMENIKMFQTTDQFTTWLVDFPLVYNHLNNTDFFLMPYSTIYHYYHNNITIYQWCYRKGILVLQSVYLAPVPTYPTWTHIPYTNNITIYHDYHNNITIYHISNHQPEKKTYMKHKTCSKPPTRYYQC